MDFSLLKEYTGNVAAYYNTSFPASQTIKGYKRKRNTSRSTRFPDEPGTEYEARHNRVPPKNIKGCHPNKPLDFSIRTLYFPRCKSSRVVVLNMLLLINEIFVTVSVLDRGYPLLGSADPRTLRQVIISPTTVRIAGATH